MPLSSEDRQRITYLKRDKSKHLFELEEVIDMLAKLDDEGHSRCRVYLESADGSTRIPVSFIELDKSEGVIVIG